MNLEPHPDVPPGFAGYTLPIYRSRGSWYRIHARSRDAIYFGRNRLHRFDAPDGRYGVLYASESLEGAFMETFGHVTGIRIVTTEAIEGRRFTILHASRDALLVDLTGPGLHAVGADNRLCCGGDYNLSRTWSAAFHDHPDRIDGIRFRSRVDPDRISVAFFEREGDDSVLSAGPPEDFLTGENARLLAAVLKARDFGMR